MSDPTRTDIVPPATALRLEGLELAVVDGPDRGTRQPVLYGVTRVGTASGSHLRLTDATVSRSHCEVRLRHDDLRLLDNGSTNGTFLDGNRVYEAGLLLGTTVRVGATMLRIEPAPEPLHVQVSDKDAFGALVGKSFEMRRIYTVLERISPTETTVLVQGETGTGKEVVARAIHEASRRAGGPFVAIDCGSIAENLIEAELFGHVRGAFTGALGDRRGLFEQAHGGTLFLDEIGELPLPMQPKLLRALESREVRPVGANTPRPVDVRVVAATNRRLDRSVNEGTFREDLYYRLAVVELFLPPLRARREDVPLLARHFFRSFSGGDAFPEALVPTLLSRSWPGNVRELRNFIERSISLGFAPAAATQAVSPDLEAIVPVDRPLKEARAVWEAQFERAYVRALLRKTGGSVAQAAEIAGVSRRTIQRMLAGKRDDE
jgi:transcriptional regulator with PAS, ATPase and Fis domain